MTIREHGMQLLIQILINKKQPIKNPPLIQNDEILYESQSIANAFNDYFINLFNSSNSTEMLFKKYMKQSNSASFYLEPTNPLELIHHAKTLSNSSTLDLHLISNKVLKIIIYPISNILSSLFNKIIISGIYPNSLKISKVIPIHKKDSIHDASNYRPISIVPCFSKLLEKIIKLKLDNFLNKHNILSNLQFGFRKDRSTEDAIIKFVNDVVNNINNNYYTLALFIDFSKAFDCINHQILISKLTHHGIRGLPLQLLESYLMNRSQYVTINNINSKTSLITSGVPQGSVLGPLLFNIFISDILNITNICKFIIFADDCTLYTRSLDITDLANKLNISLAHIEDWSNLNKMSINYNKTKYMQFNCKKITTLVNLPININDHTIEKVDCFRLLGVYLDNKLNFKHHIDQILTKININLSIIRRIKPFLNLKTCKILYYSLFYSHFYYCNIIWGGANKTDIDQIYNAQKKIVKILFFKNPYKQITNLNLFNENQILSIFEINKFKSCLLIHKILYLPNSFHALHIILFSFNIFNHSHHIRSLDNYLIKPILPKNKLSQRNFQFYGILYWNNLPSYLRLNNNFIEFKKTLKEFLICQS